MSEEGEAEPYEDHWSQEDEINNENYLAAREEGYQEGIAEGRKLAEAELWTDEDLYYAWSSGIFEPGNFTDWLNSLKETRKQKQP